VNCFEIIFSFSLITGAPEHEHVKDSFESSETVPAPPEEDPVPPNPPEPPAPEVEPSPAAKVPERSSQSEQPAPPPVTVVQTATVDPMVQSTQATVVDPMLQNAQMQYSAANYMYPQHMTDPSMMSNYSYMAGNYNDYMSMYNPMQQQQYANSYASYQNYNYAYPAMQQMYDGRNMAQYAGSYPAQMLTATPPLPSAQTVKNFNPPLPTETSSSNFSKVLVNPNSNVDSQPALQVKSDVAKSPEDTETAEKSIDGNEDGSNNVEAKESTDVNEDEMDQESEKLTDDRANSSQTNSVSEDVNR
jgi:hypothetical protein